MLTDLKRKIKMTPEQKKKQVLENQIREFEREDINVVIVDKRAVKVFLR